MFCAFVVWVLLFIFVDFWFILIFPRCVESGVSYLSSRVESVIETSNGHSHVVCEYDVVVPSRYDNSHASKSFIHLSIIYGNFWHVIIGLLLLHQELLQGNCCNMRSGVQRFLSKQLMVWKLRLEAGSMFCF